MQKVDYSSIKPTVNGWAIECRLNAEDPLRNFAPSSGMLGEVVWPEGIEDPSSGPDPPDLVWLIKTTRSKMKLLEEPLGTGGFILSLQVAMTEWHWVSSKLTIPLQGVCLLQ